MSKLATYDHHHQTFPYKGGMQRQRSRSRDSDNACACDFYKATISYSALRGILQLYPREAADTYLSVIINSTRQLL